MSKLVPKLVVVCVVCVVCVVGLVGVVCLVFVAGVAVGARAASQTPKLFAVELTRGPAWDTSKPAAEQPGFSEHSANIKRLTDTQALVIGARYGDKGLLIVTRGG